MRFIWCMPRCRYREPSTYERVKQVLKLIQHKKIENTIQLLENKEPFPNSPGQPLLLGPVGRECHPKYLRHEEMTNAINTVLKVLDDLHQIKLCHCDVRWPNVILDIKENKFVLIDFEYARMDGHDCPPIKEKFIHRKILDTKKWYAFGDTYQVILMIKRWREHHRDISCDRLESRVREKVEQQIQQSRTYSHWPCIILLVLLQDSCES